MQQNAEADSGFDGAAKWCSGFGHTEVQRVIDVCGHQPVGLDHAVYVRGFKRNDDV